MIHHLKKEGVWWKATSSTLFVDFNIIGWWGFNLVTSSVSLPLPLLLTPTQPTHLSLSLHNLVMVATGPTVYSGGRHNDTNLEGFERTNADDINTVDDDDIECSEDIEVVAVAVPTDLVNGKASFGGPLSVTIPLA